MSKLEPEATLSKVIAIGSFVTSVFLMSSTVTDPVNVTKLFALSICGTAVFMLIFVHLGIGFVPNNHLLYFFSSLFLLASLISVFFSSAPYVQNIYGAYGRNTGFLAYAMLTFILIGSASLRRRTSVSLLVYALLSAGFLNILYCGWALLFGDFLGWDNPYGEILGTFGNPNFIGAFLGISVAVGFAFLFDDQISPAKKLLLVLIVLIGCLEIQKSRAVQGVVVAAGGFSIVLFYQIRAKTKSWKPAIGYSFTVLFLGLISLLGALQVGPLAQIIYKVSVSLRGEYWAAGMRMGLDRPLTGVGMDTYGDWYRRMRDAGAMVLPGPNVVTNAAHNVVIDIFAYGGLPLLLGYLGLFSLGIVAIVKITIRSKEYDSTFVALTAIFVCYQVQSIISINQIGIAIWGWVSCGALIAFERFSRGTNPEVDSKRHARTKVNTGYREFFSAQLIAGIGMVIGALLAGPPLLSDVKWRNALVSQNATQVEMALSPSLFNPQNSFRYTSAIQLFEQNNLTDKAHEISLTAVKFNPDDFYSWKALYLIKASSESDREIALRNMQRLDPLNPDVASIQ